MTFTQQTFLGASIRSFSSTVGWGTQPSTLEVALVEDPVNNDSFDPPIVGSPVYFKYDNWTFGGLLQAFTRSYGNSGNSVINVQIQDPRELLDGVQLILQDYYTSTSQVPNLYNIYGYLENRYGFGGSRSNDTGVPWKLVREGLITLQGLNPISFRGHHFIISPFLGMDVLPDYYRIGGDSISLLDFINDICGAISCDYFIDMPYQSNRSSALHPIALHLINRSTPMRDGAIDEFVTSVEGAVSKEQGNELRNEVTTKFVIGGKFTTLYFQPQAYTGDDDRGILYNNTITPYWGYDCFDNLVFEKTVQSSDEDTPDYTWFRIDGRAIARETGNQWLRDYKTDVNEMRAALAGQDSWEAYLWYKNQDPNTVHYGKADLLGLVDGLGPEFMAYIQEVRAGTDATAFAIRPPSSLKTGKDTATRAFSDKSPASIFAAKVFNFVNMFASEYYGKKFMVRIPFVYGTIEDETGVIKFDIEPTDGGYVDEAYWNAYAINGYMPYNVEKFTLPDNRIQSYVRFVNVSTGSSECNFEVDKLNSTDYILDQLPNSRVGLISDRLFVKCALEPQMVFINKRTLFSPRVVITLPNMVGYNALGRELKVSFDIWDDIRADFLKMPGCGVSEAKVDELIKRLRQGFGSEVLWWGYDSLAYTPDLAVLALQNNTMCYGPWYAAGSAGKVVYEKDDSLVPWKYGGYAAMQAVGWAKVNDALSSLQMSEKGTVEFPGVPDRQLGQALVDSGPTVTDISVSVSEGGVTTTYRMNTWSHQFGRLGKYNVERFARLSKLAQEQRKAFRVLFGYPPPISDYYKSAAAIRAERPRRHRNKSSSTLIGGNIVVSGTGEDKTVKVNIAAMASYRLNSQLDPDEYPTQAAMALDGLFVPYTTNPATTYESNLPHLEEPTSTKTPTVTDLNPFGSQGISMALPEAQEIPAAINTELTKYEGHVKAIAFKAPLMIAGWGYDIKDKPVPASESDSNAFWTNHKNRADQWKVGPLDVRWDNSRKLWTLPQGSSIINSVAFLGVVHTTIQPMSSGLADRNNQGWTDDGSLDGVFNPLDHELQTGLQIYYREYKGWTGLIAIPVETLPPRLGIVYSTIAKNSTGQVYKTAIDWYIGDNPDYDDVYNPHNIDLPTGLRVKYTIYNDWGNRYVVEPFDYTACSGVEDQGYNQ